MKNLKNIEDVFINTSDNRRCKANLLKTKDSTQKVKESALHSNIQSKGIKKQCPQNEYGIAHEIMTSQELEAVTRGDTMYEAAASILIRRGIWEIKDEVAA